MYYMSADPEVPSKGSVTVLPAQLSTTHPGLQSPTSSRGSSLQMAFLCLEYYFSFIWWGHKTGIASVL